MIGIIGGTGFYDLLENDEYVIVDTPFGKPTGTLKRGKIGSENVIFLARHGENHTHPPHKINYRANIYAMKKLGVDRIIAFASVGSLKEEIKPGDFVVSDNFFDHTKSRNLTFYDGIDSADEKRVIHISIPEPFCPELREIAISTLMDLKFPFHRAGTCVCIEGARFSTKAESEIFRSWALDTINMTLVPEVVLARELGMCYVNISTITDYDVWHSEPVSAQMVMKTAKKNQENSEKFLVEMISRIGKKSCDCEEVLKDAFQV
jgi:5'-methylthioadenosine phosphorylase